jgi:hypothetical protein
VANTLAYYDTATITAVKSFIVQAPGEEFVTAILFLKKKNENKEEKIGSNKIRVMVSVLLLKTCPG